MARVKGIYKRGNVWWIRYAGLDGRIRFESGGKSFKEAQDLLLERKNEVKEGKAPVPKKRIANHTLNELSEHYEAWVERQRSFRSKKGFIKQLKVAFGNIPLRHFNTRLVEEYQSKGLAGGKAPATINRHIGTLKHMIRKAVDWDMVEEESLKRVRRVKLLPENNRRLRYLSKEECKFLIGACCKYASYDLSHLRPIVITALNTGARKEEILSLEWERHIDLRHGFILLDRTKNGDRREIPINGAVREALQAIVRRIDSPYVFVDGEGRRFKDVKRSFATALRKAGIKDFRFHDLRHTFASHLVMAGIDITTVKELLGHKTLTMTLRYTHLAPAHKVKAVEVLQEALSEKPTIQKLYNLREGEVTVNA